MDVASQTAWRNSPLSSACLPASTVETPIHSPMFCVHLLLGLPLPVLPSHVPSKNSLSNVLCRLMWPKYDSFCFLIGIKSCGAFTPSCSRTLVVVIFSKMLHHNVFADKQQTHFFSQFVIRYDTAPVVPRCAVYTVTPMAATQSMGLVEEVVDPDMKEKDVMIVSGRY